jgi:L-alanine-DL-glutamate epimerase-like enolase superfamily enzyme
MVDLNQWWRMAGDIVPGLGPQDGRRLIERLADYGVLWVEEPLAGIDLTGMRMLREQGRGVRIAGGEMARTFDELRLALDQDALDVYQPDVVLALGISGTRTLAELALRRNRWFTPHTWTNGIGLLANLHVCCGVGGGPYLEYPYDPPGWTPERRDFMLTEPLRIDRDGCLRVPASPGLGIELDEEAVEFHALEVGSA